jgi:hypothetical protein
MGEIKNAYNIWLENLKRREYLENLAVDGKIILEWLLGRWVGKV